MSEPWEVSATRVMTRAEHYREAERLVAEYRAYREHRKGASFIMTPLWLSEAIVHATLAAAGTDVETAARDSRHKD